MASADGTIRISADFDASIVQNEIDEITIGLQELAIRANTSFDNSIILNFDQSCLLLVADLYEIQNVLSGISSVPLNFNVADIFSWIGAVSDVLTILNLLGTAENIAAIAQGAMTVATGIWEGVCMVATGVTTAFGAAMQFLLSPIGLIILGVAALIAIIILLVENWNFVRETAVEIWTAISEFFMELWATITEAVSVAWQAIVDFIVGVWTGIIGTAIQIWSAIAVFFSELWTGINDTITSVWNGIVEFFTNIWGSIQEVFTVVGTWFMDNVVTPIQDAFQGLKDKVLEIWHGIWSGIKGVINWIIGGVEGFVNGVINGINSLIKGLNSVIGGAGDLIGAEISIPLIANISLPRLAKGAVIPPNRQFLAVLGDQKSGTNIEAPLSTIEEAVINAINKAGAYSTNDVNVSIEFKGALSKIGQILEPYVTAETRRRGNSAVKVGA
ncbi:hypothetical protein AAFA46_08075 [Oscillospiraceae bacterium WX1]